MYLCRCLKRKLPANQRLNHQDFSYVFYSFLRLYSLGCRPIFFYTSDEETTALAGTARASLDLTAFGRRFVGHRKRTRTHRLDGPNSVNQTADQARFQAERPGLYRVHRPG